MNCAQADALRPKAARLAGLEIELAKRESAAGAATAAAAAAEQRAGRLEAELSARDARERTLQQQVTPMQTLGATSKPLSEALSLAELVAEGCMPEDTIAASHAELLSCHTNTETVKLSSTVQPLQLTYAGSRASAALAAACRELQVIPNNSLPYVALWFLLTY